MITRRGLLESGLCVAATAGLPLASTAMAQGSYPNRPIRLVIISVAGDVMDVLGRIWAEEVKSSLGTVVMDNRPGAGGLIGANEAMRAAADGYTLLLGSTTTHVVLPLLARGVLYDPFKDFVGASIFSIASTCITVHPSVPVKTLSELIAYAKKNPGKLSRGSTGMGSLNHLAGELFVHLGGDLKITHIPYKGMGQAMSDLLSGEVPVFTPNLTSQILELHRLGKVRILAVNADQRVQLAPDLPTAAEEGLPGMVAKNFQGIFARSETPKEVLELIERTMRTSMASESFKKTLLKNGYEPQFVFGAADTGRFVKEDFDHWAPIIKRAGITLD